MYFFDTYALLEIVSGNPNYEAYRKEPIVTSVMNMSEFYFILLREEGKTCADFWIESLQPDILDIDIATIRKAMILRLFHKKKKMSMVDCISYVLARKNNLLFLTGDNAFNNLNGVQFVKM